MNGDLLLEMRRAVQNRNVFSWPAAVREHNELPTEKSHTLSRQRECLLLAGSCPKQLLNRCHASGQFAFHTFFRAVHRMPF